MASTKANPARIVLFGPPGAGKGTQATLLSKALNVCHISTGDIMRQAVANQTELGKQIKAILDRGELVPDSMVIKMVEERLSDPDCADGFVLDGFPRTVDQAKALSALIAKLGGPNLMVIELIVPDERILERIRRRSAEAGNSARSDDSEDVARNRIMVYWAQTAPVSDYYRARKELKDIDGVGKVEDVNARLIALVKGRPVA